MQFEEERDDLARVDAKGLRLLYYANFRANGLLPSGGRRLRLIYMKNALVAMAGLLSWLCLVDALAFSPIPRESAKSLGATKSRKPIDDGLVFVNGRFVPPPYVVERWGTGIRVNGVQVTGQVVDWTDFLRTQDGVTLRPSAAPAPAPSAAQPPSPSPEPEPAEFEEVSCELDYLFDDEAAPSRQKKKSAKPKPSRPVQKKKAPPKPSAPPPVPVLEGKFAMNDAAKAMLARVNAARTEIDRVLRGGGFICFGDGYSRLTGDRKSAERLMAVLPEVQQRAESAEALKDAARAAGLQYLHDAACDDLFRNRIGYRALQERRDRLARDREWKELLGPDGSGGAR